MLLTRFCALALSANVANAFKDTSPFFLFSTSELLFSSPQLVTASSLTKNIIPQLSKCISDTYVIVSQPGANAADYERRSASYLRMKMLGNDKSVRSSLAVKDVLGAMDPEGIGRMVQEKCEAGHLRVDASTGSFEIADDMRPRVINLDFPALPAGSWRASKLVENDAFLASVLDLLSSTKYTVIYTTSPSSAPVHSEPAHSEPYQMDSLFQAPVHMDLKRDLSNHERDNAGNITLPEGPLFERYAFFTPGLFMGIVVMLILLYILYVAIAGVASLQVSYAAFDSETGPSKQLKQN